MASREAIAPPDRASTCSFRTQWQRIMERSALLGWHIFRREVKVRYRRAFLGFFWAVASVVALGASITYVGTELGLSPEASHVPYPLFVIGSLIIWNAFSTGVSSPQQIARRLRTILRRTPFEREAILVASLLFVAFDFVLRLPILIAVFAYYGVVPPPTVALALLVGIPTVALAGLAVGAMLAPISLVTTDVRYALPFVQGALILATPVFYTSSRNGILAVINRLNPLTYLITTSRSWLLGGGWEPQVVPFLAAAGGAIGLSCFAIFYYRRSVHIGVVHI